MGHSGTQILQRLKYGGLGGAPRLPHPAAKALAVPTTLALNMEDVQNWQHTKVASAKPMKQRATMNPAELVTTDMQNTAQAHTEMSNMLYRDKHGMAF